MRNDDLFPEEPAITETIQCDDLDRSMSDLIDDHDYRLFSVFPADSPRSAILERDGNFVKLEKKKSEDAKANPLNQMLVTRSGDAEWHKGRAGMQYRDLIPSRLGGKLIASHIRINRAGPVPDYVHFHKVNFQVICCIRGWCTLAYQGQGPAFRFEEGDCVLQPPGIRHRVIDCSKGFEVVELSSPAEHSTYAEHGFSLPTETVAPEREFEGQRFVHFRAADREFEITSQGIEKVNTGIGAASAGAVEVEECRAITDVEEPLKLNYEGSAFIFCLFGKCEVSVVGKRVSLGENDAFVAPERNAELRQAAAGTRFLLVRFR